MFSGEEIEQMFRDLGVTHVVSVPDSTLGKWEQALDDSQSIKLVRVCREGEAWAVAAGLHLAGATPLVMIQCTGLFESGDSLRNVLHDFQLPLFSVIGYRSYLSEATLPGDTAKKFTEPLLKAWNLDYVLIDEPAKRELIRSHYLACREARRPGVALIAEGRA